MGIKLIKIKELAKQLNIPESTIRTWKKRKNLPENCFVKIGGTVFINEENMNKWLANQA